MASAIKDIKKWLKRQDTHPAITSIITRILYKYTQDSIESLEEWNFDNEPDNNRLAALIKDQAEIGWDNFFKGRLAKGWGELQDTHFSSLDLPECQAYDKTGNWWAANLIWQVVYFSLNTWQIRNDILHKDKMDTEYKKERKELYKRARWWYRQAVILGTKMKKYFKKTALERQKGSNLQIADWIDTLD